MISAHRQRAFTDLRRAERVKTRTVSPVYMYVLPRDRFRYRFVTYYYNNRIIIFFSLFVNIIIYIHHRYLSLRPDALPVVTRNPVTKAEQLLFVETASFSSHGVCRALKFEMMFTARGSHCYPVTAEQLGDSQFVFNACVFYSLPRRCRCEYDGGEEDAEEVEKRPGKISEDNVYVCVDTSDVQIGRTAGDDPISYAI